METDKQSHQKLTENSTNPNPPKRKQFDIAVKLFGEVTIQDCATHEEKTVQILPCRDDIRYKAMGYNTKNYVEITRISDASGDTSVSEESPLGKALLGNAVGETVSYKVGIRTMSYCIMAIKQHDGVI